MSMPISDPLAVESLSELETILRWLGEKGEGPEEPTTVLIGGWAVYAYNPYFGSIDVDLITNRRTRSSLMHHLRLEHRYMPRRFQGRTSVAKKTGHGEVVIDFGSREVKDRFEGRKEAMDYRLLDGNTVVKDFSGFKAPVPSRGLLVLFKLKAAHDREYRIQNNRSPDLEWEKGKLVKDHADILALVDPEKEGHDIDVGFLGQKLEEFPFLKVQLEKAKVDLEGIKKYGTTQKKAEEAVDKLLALL